MAPVGLSARSQSKCKNPIPGQAQKRLLSKGGPPEVTVDSSTLLMTPSKKHESLRALCLFVFMECTQAFTVVLPRRYLWKCFCKVVPDNNFKKSP